MVSDEEIAALFNTWEMGKKNRGEGEFYTAKGKERDNKNILKRH